MLTPPGPATTSTTVYVPSAYMCNTLLTVTLVVLPSPKSQKPLVMIPVEMLVNVTARGAMPLVGAPVNPATGAVAPAPVTALVNMPPLLVKTTLPVNEPSPLGANVTETT